MQCAHAFSGQSKDAAFITVQHNSGKKTVLQVLILFVICTVWWLHLQKYQWLLRTPSLLGLWDSPAFLFVWFCMPSSMPPPPFIFQRVFIPYCTFWELVMTVKLLKILEPLTLETWDFFLNFFLLRQVMCRFRDKNAWIPLLLTGL